MPVLTQAAQAQHESTCGCVILKMAVNIKDLYGNSGNKLTAILRITHVLSYG